MTPEIVEQIIKSFATIIGATVIAVFPYFVTWYKAKSRIFFGYFKKNVHLTAKINDTLKLILHRVGAQAVRVYAYHNGDKARSGFPFDYVSMTHEKTDENTKEIMPTFQKLPLSLFAELIESIINNEVKGMVRQSLNEVDGETKQQLIAYNADTVYHFLLTNKTEDGVVSVVFSRETTLTKAELDFIKFKVRSIYQLQRAIK